MLSEMRELEAQVSQLRGIPASRAVERRLLTSDGLREYLREAFLGDYSPEEAQADASMYAFLGLLPEALDLRQLYLDLFNEQLAGFYDVETDEMVVVCDESFTGVERLTYVHEYVHTLQDQRYDFEAGLAYTDAACDDEPERCAAIRALFEGDAALLQEQWLRRLARAEDLEDLAAFFSTFTMPIYDSAPSYIKATFTFPYLEGLFFVRSLYLKGGWAAVDAAYQAPPQSTEHILHPDRYPRDEPVALPVPDLSGSGWQVTHQDVLGEWTLLKLLETQLAEEEASKAAEGWGGDIAILLSNPQSDAQALLQLIQWDTMRDAHEFTAAYKSYGEQRFGESDRSTSTSAEWTSNGARVLLDRHSNQTLIIIGPPEEVSTLRDLLTLPYRVSP